MKRSQLDLCRFEKVLALLDSDIEGEALAALGRAKHMLAGADVRFSQLTVGISSSQGFGQEEVMGSAHEQKLEQELESLRWSLACHELQIATLRQSMEGKSSLIKSEQTKLHTLEGELAGLRKAYAVQMDEALNHKEEVEKATVQIQREQAMRRVQEGELAKLRKAHAVQKEEAQRDRAAVKEKTTQIQKDQEMRRVQDGELATLRKINAVQKEEAQSGRAVVKEKTAQFQKEQAMRRVQDGELITLRKINAVQRDETLSRKVEAKKKTTQIETEQAKRIAQEKELISLRKAHAVQMEEAQNRKDEVEKLSKQVETYLAAEKAKEAASNRSLRAKPRRRKTDRETYENPVIRRKAKASPGKFLATKPKVAHGKNLSSRFEEGIMVHQGDLDLVGGKDNSVGMEYRWTKIEEKHQILVGVPKPENDVSGSLKHPGVMGAQGGLGSQGVQVSQGRVIGLQAKA